VSQYLVRMAHPLTVDKQRKLMLELHRIGMSFARIRRFVKAGEVHEDVESAIRLVVDVGAHTNYIPIVIEPIELAIRPTDGGVSGT